MNFMSVYVNIYNWTREISKIFLFYPSDFWSVFSYPTILFVIDYSNTLNIKVMCVKNVKKLHLEYLSRTKLEMNKYF